MLKEIKAHFNAFLNQIGYISEEELALSAVSKEKRRRAKNLQKYTSSVKSRADINNWFAANKELAGIYKEAYKNGLPKRTKDAISLVSMSDLYGYKPGMSRMYNLFAQNPFGLFAFISRHHPAIRGCIQVIMDEIANDGYVLISEKGTSRKRLKEVYRRLKSTRIPDMRLTLAKHLKIYGNAWILPHNNMLGGKSDVMQILSPPRILPDIDPVTDRIRGWLYKPGPGVGTINLPVDKVWHLRLMSMDDYRPIGDPPLGPAILDIEADMAASAFNNQVFQKGGLLGLIVSIKVPDTIDPFGDEELDYTEELQERVNTEFSGAKAGQSMLVSPNIDNVYNVNPVGKLDSSFKTLHYETAKTIALCLGVPPEKIAVSRSDTLQYIPSLVEDSVNTSFDKSMNNLINYIDEFINEKILKERFGITDILIQSGGRYGALTTNACEAIKTLADAGPIITVNDAFERILGWEPLPADNPRGQWVLDNTKGRMEGEKSTEVPRYPGIVDQPEQNMDLGKSLGSEEITKKPDIKWFGRIEKTYHSDDETIVHRAVIGKWGIKFFEEPGRNS